MAGLVRRVRRRFASTRRKPLPRVPDVSGKRFLFLGGLHRSGTSVLHRVLREHDGISGFTDTPAQQDEGQHLQTVYPNVIRAGGPGRFAFYPENHITEHSPLVSPENIDRLLREWCAYHELDKPVLLEKSPPNLIRSRFLQAMFQRSYFVFVIRHPIPVALATRKWSSTTATELMLHWSIAHSLMMSDRQHLANCLMVRYEDLVRSPAGTLAGICRFAGLDEFRFGESIEDRNEEYFRDWTEFESGAMEDFKASFPGVWAFMEQFGYKLESPFVNDPGTL